ncbi:hypothetical protein TWF696_002997 [Orbilia brochopaga]|uniref:Uncharacterized protein n=1 Tax=Orbilia brochopaga TaxID=3140254 RepID=A0AAV9U2F8_9PEZI
MSAASQLRRSPRNARRNPVREITTVDAATQTDVVAEMLHQSDGHDASDDDPIPGMEMWNPAWLRGEPFAHPLRRRIPGDDRVPLHYEDLNPAWLRGAPGAPPFVCRKPIEPPKEYMPDGTEILPAIESWPDPLDRIPGLLRLLDREETSEDERANIRALIKDLEEGKSAYGYQDGLPVEYGKEDKTKPLYPANNVSYHC